MLYETFTHKDTTVTLSAWSFENSRNWGHKAEVSISRRDIDGHKTRIVNARAKQIYYNRTWESYQYQTVLISAMRNLIENIDIKGYFKSLNGYKKMTTKRNADFQEYLSGITDRYNRGLDLTDTEEMYIVANLVLNKVKERNELKGDEI